MQCVTLYVHNVMATGLTADTLFQHEPLLWDSNSSSLTLRISQRLSEWRSGSKLFTETVRRK